MNPRHADMNERAAKDDGPAPSTIERFENFSPRDAQRQFIDIMHFRLGHRHGRDDFEVRVVGRLFWF